MLLKMSWLKKMPWLKSRRGPTGRSIGNEETRAKDAERRAKEAELRANIEEERAKKLMKYFIISWVFFVSYVYL